MRRIRVVTVDAYRAMWPRGKPVAILQSLGAVERPTSLEARLATLAASGLVALPAGKRMARIKRVRVTGAPVSRTILEDRR